MLQNHQDLSMENETYYSNGLCYSPLYKGTIILENGDVVFSLYAPDSKSIKVRGLADDTGFGTVEYDLIKQEDGNWTTTISGLRAGLHYYEYIVDGFRAVVGNCPVYYGWGKASNCLEIPDRDIDFYLMKDVAHGEVRHQFYKSELTGKTRQCLVYTPPSYDNDLDKKYPVLYLQHGSGESETSWLWQGKINNIIDNLLAENKAEEMLIVMDFGYAFSHETLEADIDQNKANIFNLLIVNELVPYIESKYRVIADRKFRAIAGLSMGGGQALRIGFGSIDKFSWIGAFSCGSIENVMNFSVENQRILSNPDDFEKLINLLFIACGAEDKSYENALRGHNILVGNKIKHTWYTCSGTHEWQVWRKHANEFLQCLFKSNQ